MTTHVTRRIVMNIMFLIVDDVVNPIIASLLQNHYYSSGLVIQGYVKSPILQWEDPEHTVFDSQSTNQIIAEIGFEVNSESRLSHSVGQDNPNQEANQAQCLKIPETKALKKLIAVNGFTGSVLQCDGHAGLKNKLVVTCHYPLESVLHTVIRVKVLWRDFTGLSMSSQSHRDRLADPLGLHTHVIKSKSHFYLG